MSLGRPSEYQAALGVSSLILRSAIFAKMRRWEAVAVKG